MARPLGELRALQKTHGGAPIFYAGDVFDRWNSPPEVINFALEHLPKGYAVPGQHDIPHHAPEEIKRSAYWTLVAAGHLVNLSLEKGLQVGALLVYGFPWGCPLQPVEPIEGILQIAIAHHYVWTKDTGYPEAPKEGALASIRAALRGYDAIALGDNHKGFISKGRICNCGGLMRRAADEVDYRPGVGLLHADGSITRHYLDTGQDTFTVYTEAEERVAEHLDMTAFMDGLRDLEAGDALDFEAALRRFIRDNDVPDQVARVILEAQEG